MSKYTLGLEMTNPVGLKYRLLLRDGDTIECPISGVVPIPDNLSRIHIVRSSCNTACRYFEKCMKKAENKPDIIGYRCLAQPNTSFVIVEEEPEKETTKLKLNK